MCTSCAATFNIRLIFCTSLRLLPVGLLCPLCLLLLRRCDLLVVETDCRWLCWPELVGPAKHGGLAECFVSGRFLMRTHTVLMQAHPSGSTSTLLTSQIPGPACLTAPGKPCHEIVAQFFISSFSSFSRVSPFVYDGRVFPLLFPLLCSIFSLTLPPYAGGTGPCNPLCGLLLLAQQFLPFLMRSVPRTHKSKQLNRQNRHTRRAGVLSLMQLVEAASHKSQIRRELQNGVDGKWNNDATPLGNGRRGEREEIPKRDPCVRTNTARSLSCSERCTEDRHAMRNRETDEASDRRGMTTADHSPASFRLLFFRFVFCLSFRSLSPRQLIRK